MRRDPQFHHELMGIEKAPLPLSSRLSLYILLRAAQDDSAFQSVKYGKVHILSIVCASPPFTRAFSGWLARFSNIVRAKYHETGSVSSETP